MLSLGSWRTYGISVEDAVTEACMVCAYEAGINYFDGAEAYGRGAAEQAMGRVLTQQAWPRDTFIVSSKVIQVGDRPTQRGLSRKHLVEACDAALQRLQVEYLDLFFCHRPDPLTPLEEIVHTMNELIQRGKIFYWGTSEFSATDLTACYEIAARDHLQGPTMEQTNHSMLQRQRVEGELVPVFQRYGLGTTIYSPLAVGVLTGKYNDGIPAESAIGRGEDWMKRLVTEDRMAKARQLTKVAADMGVPLAQLALAWCLKNPNVHTAIIGATRPEQITENVGAVEVVERLDDAVMERIETILSGDHAA